jgi:hypothetical protein
VGWGRAGNGGGGGRKEGKNPTDEWAAVRLKPWLRCAWGMWIRGRERTDVDDGGRLQCVRACGINRRTHSSMVGRPSEIFPHISLFHFLIFIFYSEKLQNLKTLIFLAKKQLDFENV